jgi:carbon-monoxide dehydrogenase medium subunit
VEELATDYYESVIEPTELLTRLTIPLPSPQGAGAFLKFLPRTADDYATVSAAAWISLSPQGACQEVRIGLGSVGSTAVRARQAESLLQGQEPTPERLRLAAEAVVSAISPMDDLRGSADYKREMAAVITRRALEAALARAKG